MKKKKEYFVYILECKDKSLYTGITVDLKRRIGEHNFSDKGQNIQEWGDLWFWSIQKERKIDQEL